MSAIAQVAATVAATPLPTPSPQVIKEVFTVPGQMPAVVIQAAQIAAMFGAAFLLSVIHKVTEWFTTRNKEGGWSPQLNAGLATAYSLGVGVVGASTMHQLGGEAQQLVALAISTFTAMAGSFWTYSLRKAIGALSAQGVKAETTTETLAPANGQDPAQGVG